MLMRIKTLRQVSSKAKNEKLINIKTISHINLRRQVSTPDIHQIKLSLSNLTFKVSVERN